MMCTSTRFHVPKHKATNITYRSYKHFNEEQFVDELSRVPYHVAEIFDDVDDSYWFFNSLTMQIVDDHAPVKTKIIKGKRIPYMNSELRKSTNVKNMLKRKYDKCKNKTNWLRFRTQRNIVTNMRKKSMRIFMQNKCNVTKGGGGFWEAVKPLISHKSVKKNDNIILLNNDDIVNNRSDVCNIFNEYFINVTSDIGSDDRLNYNDNTMSCAATHDNHSSIECIKSMDSSYSTEFSFHNVNVSAVKSHLYKLNVKKATGPDMLPAKLLKIGSDILCYPVCYLLNVCITQGIFPRMLKCADVSPIYKKGNTMDVGNYRPVSILPIMSKVFEKVIINQISPYFDSIFHPCVSGFRKGYSCETVLVNMVESIKCSLDKGNIVCCILMDLSRAFDCIPHKLLISKFKAYGVSVSACDVITSYLKDRRQRVKIGTQRSEWMHAHKGSAQGSLFGPFSYNVFTNDMFNLLDDDVEIYNYADDNTILCSGKCLTDVKAKLLDNVNRLIGWYHENNMKVNSEKFQCIIFGNVDDPGEFIIDKQSIVPEKTVKLLGIHLDNKLTFHDHISHICQKASKQVNVLARLSNVLSESNKMLLYNSFIECYFNYCCTLWHFCSNVDTFKVEKIQKRALRYVSRQMTSPYEELLQICQKSPLYIVRLRKIAELVYMVSENMCPTYLNNLFTNNLCNRTLRSAHNKQLPTFNTVKYGKRSIKYNGPQLWNSLPDEMKTSSTLSAFKQNVKLWCGIECKCGFCVSCKIMYQ